VHYGWAEGRGEGEENEVRGSGGERPNQIDLLNSEKLDAGFGLGDWEEEKRFC